jgi:crotonobetainyl-CoA:carnitine CoA-transferase CaiB-like acyl-CoA transferase
LQTIDDGDEGDSLAVPNPAFRFADSSAHARGKAPALGADGAAVLARVLGYDAERIAQLQACKALRLPEQLAGEPAAVHA